MKLALLLTLTLSFSALANEQDCIDTTTSFIDKIKCLNDVEVVSHTPHRPGSLKIEMLFKQKEDHFGNSPKSFKQRIVLLHRDYDYPMLLQTSGYSIFGVRFAAIAKVYETNQIQVEHRFFEKSIATNPSWAHLNIKQSAHDFHRITEAFKKIYKNNWVGTGASKGGMTSVYHKYFYPNDLVGTVADVAPLSFSTSDQRYNVFLENVGGEAYRDCRESFKEMQILMLRNAAQLVPRIKGEFTQLGGPAVAFEHSIIEAPFYFWQYGNPKTCNNLPDTTDMEAVFKFFAGIADVKDYTDSKLKRFVSYYFQAATELGNPGTITDHLEIYRDFEFLISQYTPKGIEIPYSNISMRKVRDWVKNDADNIIFVYGEFDPWTAGEFPVSSTGKNIYKFSVAAGNHSANFTKLDDAQKSEANSILTKWLGKAPSFKKSKFDDGKSLEDLEFKARSQFRL